MGSPCHISGSAQELYFQNKTSAEFRALSMTAELLVHPQRTLLNTFFEQAVDRDVASQFFLDQVSGENEVTIFDFLTDWVELLQKDLEESVRREIWQRDQNRCCISKVEDGREPGSSLLLTYVLSPSLFCGNDMTKNEKLYKMFAAFIGESQLQDLRSLIGPDSSCSNRDRSNQLMLLSSRTFDHFANGRLSLKIILARVTKDSYQVEVRDFLPPFSVGDFHSITLENKAIGLALLPNTQLLEIHHRLADAFAWLEVSEYMKQAFSLSYGVGSREPSSSIKQGPGNENSWYQSCLRPVSKMLRYAWPQLPAFFRAFAYRSIIRISSKLNGDSGSDRVYRLPSNFYLRVADCDWAPKHQAEFQSLRLVERYTHIPAPRALDTVRHSDHSFLLMTGLRGEIIGRRIATMTDKQLHQVVQDLKSYIFELRQIPNRNNSKFKICNALGDGIFDWRIGDSQREKLRFRDATHFDQYLIDNLPFDENEQKLIFKAHSIKHDIVFTHADLNMRNILVDENGRISGIVDWECAGWYPEYWEYTKAHFTVRLTIRWLADVIDQVFVKYRDELRVENMLASKAPSW